MAVVSTSNPPVIPGGLAKLEAAIGHDLDILDYPGREWVRSRETSDGTRILDVLIIGAGQGGLSVAFALMREKVTNILLVDQNQAAYEGPWRTFARMITLRTPKYVTGPDQNLPNLTIRAWYEAQYGEDAWQDLHLIPKETWADYLFWYRNLLGIPVENETQAGALEWVGKEQCFAVPLTHQGQTRTVYARKVVLATGIDGSGQWTIPDMVKNNLQPSLYAHTRDDIDFEALRGKRIGVLGAGASAFDNASVALETGAGEVHLYFRRNTLPNVNPYRWAEFVGFLKHHGDMPDADRWRTILQILRMGQLPPTDTYERACQHASFYLHPGSPWQNVEQVGDKVHLTTPNGTQELDFLIIGTGFVTDLSLRPELANLYPHIALWSDRYTPPEADRHEDLGRHPYLGGAFEFTEKTPGTAPHLRSVFNYTFGGLASLGFGGASISGMKYSLPKIVGGITRQLFQEDIEYYYNSLVEWDLIEFEP